MTEWTPEAKARYHSEIQRLRAETPAPADYEAQLALCRNLYDELFSQTEQLRTERYALLAERQQLQQERDKWAREAIEVQGNIVKLADAYKELEAERQQAQEEIERLRDRAVCSGCGQDVDEGGACHTVDCTDGEMIPSSDLPGAMLANCERIAEDRAEWRFDWEALRGEAKQLEVQRQQAIDALREVVRDEGSQWGWATIELAKELLVKLGEQP